MLGSGSRIRSDIGRDIGDMRLFDDDDDEYRKVGYASFLRSKALTDRAARTVRYRQIRDSITKSEQTERHGTR